MQHIKQERERAMGELQSVIAGIQHKQNDLQQLNALLVDMSVRRVQLEAYVNGLDYALTEAAPTEVASTVDEAV
jgi:hypothetical protein